LDSFDFTQVLSGLTDEMAQLENLLESVLDSDHTYLKKLHHHILQAQGKRLRPALLFLCAKMLNYSGAHHITYATVFELIHTATLIHDDVIDDAPTRRGQETLYHGEGPVLSVLFGDLLYTKANTLAIKAGSLEVMELISSVTEEMIEGELLQEKHSYNMDIQESEYFNILARKTAFLFGGTAKTAGLAAELSPEEAESLYQYGYNLGVSFQLVDDLLDYTGEQDQMGKPVLSDLLAGKMTLPVIRFRQSNPEQARMLIHEIWEKQDLQSLKKLEELIRQSSAFSEAYDMSRECALKAVSCLAPFQDNDYKDILQKIPLVMLERKK